MNSRSSRIGFAFAILASVAAGVMAGVAVGAPGLVERVAIRALTSIEARFGVTLDATAVEWTWSGGVSATGVSVLDRQRNLLGTIDKIAIASDVDLASRSLTLRSLQLQGVAVAFEQRADGSTNIDGILKGLGVGDDADTAARIPGGRFLKVIAPTVSVDGLRVVARLARERLPPGLDLPPVIGFSQGTLHVTPVGTVDEAAGLRGTTFDIALGFADTTLDPGYGFAVQVRGGATAGPELVALDFSRPLRIPFEGRLVALGGLGWDRAAETLVVRDLQLSEPLLANAGAQVAAAISLPRLTLAPFGGAALLAEARAGLAGAGSGRIRTLLAEIRQVTVEAPVVSFSRTADGRHSFEDLMGHIGGSAVSPLGGEKSPPHEAGENSPGLDTLALSFEASRRALDLLAIDASQPPNPKLAEGLRGLFDRADALVGRMLARVERVTTPVAGEPALPTLDVRGGRAVMTLAGETIELDGVDLSVAAVAKGRHIAFTANMRGSGTLPGRFQLHLSPVGDNADGGPRPVLSIRADNIATRFITPFSRTLAAMLPAGSAAVVSRLEADLTPLPGVPAGWEAVGRLVFAGVDLAWPALSDATLRGLDGDVAARVSFRPDKHIFHVSDLAMSRKGVAIRGGVDVADPLGVPRIRLDLQLPDVDVQKVFDAIPPEVVPMLAGLRLRGMLGWKLVVDFDAGRPADLRIDSRPKLVAFTVESMGEHIDFTKLRGSHPYRILLSDGTEGTRFVGPATGSWVPLTQIAPWLPLALTTTEDGTFYTHDGISTFAIRESIITNLERGAFVRGASTITQQLVKNLYLGGSKKLGRKLQEMFIAWRLSQDMSKDDIMALYLNTIEFGPGIYGIGDAAYHWFGKRAIDLDLAESIFLASIIPSPRKYHSFFEAGAVTPRWSAYLQMLLGVMVKRGKITEEDLAAAAPYAPRFRGSRAGSNATDVFDVLPDRETPNGIDTPPTGDDWDGDLLDGR